MRVLITILIVVLTLGTPAYTSADAISITTKGITMTVSGAENCKVYVIYDTKRLDKKKRLSARDVDALMSKPKETYTMYSDNQNIYLTPTFLYTVVVCRGDYVLMVKQVRA